MGVPAFFKWLTMRCPQILHDAIDDIENEVEDDNNKSTNLEIDNLYFDLNGIIHPCTHPEHLPIPKPLSEDEMFNNIFNYIDKIMNIVKPKKLVYLAIDGVAPRAKMNQQRGRRFRTALDSMKIKEKKEEIRKQWEANGLEYPEKVDEDFDKKFDANVITPGTEFMERLSTGLKYFITERMNSHYLYRNIKVIFSDATVPGEGEHKMLDFIRQQRALEHYNPNTRHCLYGADADLIMLGLSTHEPYFYILRETIMGKNEKRCTICGQTGHFFSECQLQENTKEGEFGEKAKKEIPINFQFVKLNVLREYLDLEFKKLELPFEYDLEKVIDDFVFLCFFVGNDFLPHLPTLSIREGGIDCLLFLYKRILPYMRGYFIENCEINLMRVDIFIKEIGEVEEGLLKQAARSNEYQERQRQQPVKILDKKKEDNIESSNRVAANKLREELKQLTETKEEEAILTQTETKEESDTIITATIVQISNTLASESNIEENQLPNPIYTIAELPPPGESINAPEEEPDIITEIEKKAPEEILDPVEKFKIQLNQALKVKNDSQAEVQVDDLRLGESGFKRRYYWDKFRITAEDFPEFRSLIQQAYIEGLCWVFAYYYKGCVSWNWYYPFHYAPFASDIIGIDKLKISFDQGEPFKPFDQLLAVLPPYSSTAIPKCLRPLMLEEESELVDFYPKDVYIDSKGKKFSWMGEVLLPMIDEDRLLKAVRKFDSELLPHEQERNKIGHDLIFVNIDMPLMQYIQEKMTIEEIHAPQYKIYLEYSKTEIGGELIGYPHSLKMNRDYQKPLDSDAIENIKNNTVIAMGYNNPPHKAHITELLEGVALPPLELSEAMFEYVDRKYFAGNRVIKLLERLLEINANDNQRRGTWNNNTQGEQRIKTSWGNSAYNVNPISNYNNFFNNNRGVHQEPTQFKRYSNPNMFGSLNTESAGQNDYPRRNYDHDRGGSDQDRRTFDQGRRDYNQGRRDFDQGRRDFDQGRRDFDQGRRDFDQGRRDFGQGRRNFDQGRRDFDQGRRDFDQGRRDINQGRRDFNQGRRDFDQGRRDFNQGRRDFNQGRRDFDQSRRNYDPEARRDFDREPRRDFDRGEARRYDYRDSRRTGEDDADNGDYNNQGKRRGFRQSDDKEYGDVIHKKKH